MASSVQDDLLNKRNDPEFLNWLAVGEALMILSDGLRQYAEKKMKELQSLLISKCVGVTCNCLCVPGKKPNIHRKSKGCTWATELGNLHRNANKHRIPWYQSDSNKWHDPADGYWEIAKVFMSDLGSKWNNVKDPASTDTTGLLNLLIFCKHIKVQQHLLEAVRHCRNEWAHAPDLLLCEPDKQSAFKDIVNLINDVELMSCKEVQDCRATIEDVRVSKVSIIKETHLRVLKELRYLKECEMMNTVEENRRHVDEERKTLEGMIKTLEGMIKTLEQIISGRDHLSGMTYYAKAILAILASLLLLTLFLVFSKKSFRILTCFFLVAFFVSQVGHKSVLLSDSGCSRCIEKSPISHFHFQEFNFSSYLSYKREKFFGRRWFFKELEDVFESDRAPSGVLITGEPGSGKSALISQLICSPFSSLLIYSNIIGYHLCDYSEKGKRDGARFVRNLVDQIAGSISEYSSHVTNNEQIRRELDKRCESDPTGCFFSTIVGPLRDLKKPDGFRYIILDALDECFEKDGKTSTILDMLNSKISQFPTWLKLIMSSRNWTAVTTKMPRTLKRMPLDPTDERNVEDIHSYITRFLSQNLFLTNRLLEAMNSKSTSIHHWVNELTDRGEGNFLFVKTTLWNSIKSDSRINLKSFPTSLYDTYDIFFKRHFKEDDFGRFKMLFEVLLAAASPRQLHEIDEILKLQNQTQEITKLVEQVSFFLRFGHNGTVSIFHQSFAEWLVNQANGPGGFIIRKNKGHQYIVDFVLDRIHRRNAELTFKELSELTTHVASGELTESYKQALEVLNVSEIRDPHSGRCILHDLAKTASGLPVLEVFLSQFVSCDIPDLEEKTPAFYAASENIVDNLKLFIDSGADVNYIFKNFSSLDSVSAVQNWGMEDYSMTHVAAYKGHTKIVELLIKSNASYAQSNQNGPTAFHLAAGNGHLEIIKLLYSNGAKADLISLHHAAARNHSAVVEFLLETARVRDECLPCRTVNLSYFSRNTTFQEFHSFFCETALHAAVSRRYIDIVKLLLRFGGASLECKHYSGKTPLMDAASRNDTEMVELLLNEGADVEATCGSEISSDSNEQMCVVSLSYKIRYLYTVYCEKHVCACGNKAIHLCATHGLWEIAEKLINKRHCNWLDKNCKGKTVWEIAKFFHHKDFIVRLNRMLLTKLEDETSLEQQPNQVPASKYRRRHHDFKTLLQKLFLKRKPYQSSYQCDSTFDGFSPLHIAALMGVKMLRRVYQKAHKLVPNLPFNCTNKHWIVPRYLAYFYDQDNPRRLKVKQKTKPDNDLAFVQYPDREAEFHIIYNYLYNSPAESANVLYYKSLYVLTLIEYNVTNCPGFYDLLPKRNTLNVKDYCYGPASRSDDVNNLPNSAKSLARPRDIYEDCRPCLCVCNDEIRLIERLRQEKFTHECFCPHIMRELQSWFTSSPRKNRKVSPFIAERMGWKDASADGDVQDRWPFYFLYKKLINDYKSYKYLETLNEGFKINHKRHDDDEGEE